MRRNMGIYSRPLRNPFGTMQPAAQAAGCFRVRRTGSSLPGRRKPGAGAVEDDPLLGHDLHDEIGILRLGDLFPGAGVDELARHILDLVFRDGVFGVVDDLEIDFVAGGGRLRERVLGQGVRAQEGQCRQQEKLKFIHSVPIISVNGLRLANLRFAERFSVPRLYDKGSNFMPITKV